MSRSILYIPILAFCLLVTSIACGTTKDTTANLPKDIYERPADEDNQKYEQAQLDKLKAEIEQAVSKEKCTDPNEWKYAPMGSKSCGGPKYYIAYPEKLGANLLPKIESYNQKEAAFNTKYGIASDCMMIPEPTGIKCKNGKAELVNATQ